MTKLRAPWLAIVLLLTAPAVFLAPSLLGPRKYMPFDTAQFPPVATTLTADELAAITADQNTDVTEVPLVFRPEIAFARQELAAGRLPEWNPFARSGAPLLATAVVGLLYPPHWLLFATADPADGLALLAWFTLAVAAFGTFGLLRALHVAPLAATFGALAFTFGGTLAANLHFYQRAGALVWLPAMLWAVLRIADGEGPRRRLAVVALAVTLAATWLAGFPAYAAPATLVTACLALFVGLRRMRRDGRSEGVATFGWLLLGAVCGFLLAAVQLLPMFAFFPESNRTPTPGAAELAAQTVDFAGLLGFVLPDAFGHPHLAQTLPTPTTPLATWFSSRTDWATGKPLLPNFNYVEQTVFPGTAVLVLAVLGIVGRGRWFRVFATVIGVVLLLLATGAPLTRAINEFPGFSSVPPLRFLGPVGLLVACLAAFGLDRLLRSTPERLRTRIPTALCVALAAGSASAWLWLRLTPHDVWLAEILPNVHAWFLGHNPDLTVDAVRSILEPSMAPARVLLLANLRHVAIAATAAALWFALLPRVGPRLRAFVVFVGLAAAIGQIATLGYAVNRGRELHPTTSTPVHEFLRARRDAAAGDGGFTVARARAVDAPPLPIQLPPCTLVPERIRDLNIYTFVDGRSHLPLTRIFGVGNMVRGFWSGALPDDERLRHPYLDLLGVRYLLSTTPLSNAGPAVGPTLEGPSGRFFVHERPTALARAFTVGTARVVPDDGAVVDALVDTALRPADAVLLTNAEAARRTQTDAGDGAGSGRKVTVVADTPLHFAVEVGPGARALLVTNDAVFSGWTAAVDGRAVPVLRGNLHMRVVEIPDRACRVEFRYRTPRLDLGIGVSVATAVFLLLFLALPGLRRRAQGAPGDVEPPPLAHGKPPPR